MSFIGLLLNIYTCTFEDIFLIVCIHLLSQCLGNTTDIVSTNIPLTVIAQINIVHGILTKCIRKILYTGTCIYLYPMISYSHRPLQRPLFKWDHCTKFYFDIIMYLPFLAFAFNLLKLSFSSITHCFSKSVFSVTLCVNSVWKINKK